MKSEAEYSGHWRDKILLGDCRELLKNIADATVDLIVTSPPYADSRKSTYGDSDGTSKFNNGSV